jgi:hypothetical protein
MGATLIGAIFDGHRSWMSLRPIAARRSSAVHQRIGPSAGLIVRVTRAVMPITGQILPLHRRQGVDQRTSGIFASVAPAHSIGKHTFQSFEIGNLRPNVLKVMCRKLANFGA